MTLGRVKGRDQHVPGVRREEAPSMHDWKPPAIVLMSTLPETIAAGDA